MDTEIIGAIIAAVATIAAPIITIVWTRRHRSGDTRGEDAHQPIGSAIDEPTQSDSLADANRRLGEMPLDDVPHAAPLPQGSRMVYSPSPLFVGRTSKFRELARILKSDTATGQAITVAVTGIGGVGKSQLASEFVHRYGRYFSGGVFWLSFANANSVPAEVAACGNVGDPELGSDFGSLPLDERADRVWSVWQSEVPRLLVFDNCEDEALFTEWRPRTGGCRVLLTSRKEKWGKALGVRVVKLDVLRREEIVVVLRQQGFPYRALVGGRWGQPEGRHHPVRVHYQSRLEPVNSLGLGSAPPEGSLPAEEALAGSPHPHHRWHQGGIHHTVDGRRLGKILGEVSLQEAQLRLQGSDASVELALGAQHREVRAQVRRSEAPEVPLATEAGPLGKDGEGEDFRFAEQGRTAGLVGH